MKKVGLVITRMVKGGASRIIRSIISGGRDKFAFSLYTGVQDISEGDLEDLKPICEIILVPNMLREINPIKDYKAYLYLRDEFRRNKFDVVHTHTSKAGFLGRFAASNAGIPRIIHTPHGTIYADNSRIKGVPDIKLGRYPFLFAERLAGRKHSFLTVLSNNERELSIKLGLSSSDNTIVIPNGIDLEKFKFSENQRYEGRKSLGLLDDDVFILSAGRLSLEKGHSLLISAFKDALKSNQNLKLGIAGEGELMIDFKKENCQLISAGKLTLFGHVDNIEMLFSAADIFVLPSFYEGFGLAVLEAMASGVPIIASDVGGIPELMENGIEGYLVPSGNVCSISNKIAELSSSSEIRLKMSVSGRKKAQGFSLDKMLSRYFELYY